MARRRSRGGAAGAVTWVLVAAAWVVLLAGCSDEPRSSPPADPRPSSTTEATSSTLPSVFSSSVHELTAADLPASWRPGCPLAVEDLRAVDATHWGFDGAVHQGRIVVAADLVDDVVGILGDLFAARYPIAEMVPVDAYGGSDARSVDANNTSAFNCRFATGSTTRWSEHAFGRAVDLNPLLNPYVVGDRVLPPQSAPYLDRTMEVPGLIRDGDAAVTAFESRGWVWGGRWRNSKDYQHFSTTGR